MGSTAFLRKMLQDVRASYWFRPIVLLVLAVLLAQFTQAADRAGWGAVLPQRLLDTQPAGARAVLGVIAQSTIGVAGVMFSMTMVAVSFASSNYGPRLIGNFMRDGRNQTSLGILIATFAYTLLILRAVQDAGSGDGAVEMFVPHLSVVVAIGLAFVSTVTVILFVHHVPETINIANITAGLGTRLCAAVEQTAGTPDARERDAPWPDGAEVQAVSAGASGYLQTLDTVALDRIAQDRGFWIEVTAMPGDFVDRQAEVLRVFAGPVLTDEITQDLRGTFALGSARTEHQNLLFVVDQLGEIVGRALSPGINDPFTAINCLNWLHAALRAAAELPPGERLSSSGRLRVRSVGFADILARGHGQIRPYVAADLNVTQAAVELLLTLAARLAQGPRRALVEREVRDLLAMSRGLLKDPVSQAALEALESRVDAELGG
ncbi:DUF2254 domain-containing protein [Pontivivens ytuae]|uniref:DUF2254 domain-containing protein n=1 Tax=Pontivivens ytuae TaxID=2789856 RepID=A0A7S9LNZ6_9RHOB|nr:DUF2254 domain-containing protein [Pontivivens ytuae]QPH52539.1 DUF2254 domain-containing protein [Pontivivens ytuae]